MIVNRLGSAQRPTAKKLGRATERPHVNSEGKGVEMTLRIKVLSSCHDFLEISADT